MSSEPQRCAPSPASEASPLSEGLKPAVGDQHLLVGSRNTQTGGGGFLEKRPVGLQTGTHGVPMHPSKCALSRMNPSLQSGGTECVTWASGAGDRPQDLSLADPRCPPPPAESCPQGGSPRTPAGFSHVLNMSLKLKVSAGKVPPHSPPAASLTRERSALSETVRGSLASLGGTQRPLLTPSLRVSTGFHLLP